MRKVLCCVLLLAFTLSLLATPFALGDAPEKNVRVTILYKGAVKTAPGFSAMSQSRTEDISAKIKKHGGTVKHNFESINAVSAEMTEAALEELTRDPNILAVERSRPVHAFLQESVPLIGASDVWQRTISGLNITGEGTSVCVIDSGVDYNHTDLGGAWGTKVIAGYNEITEQDCSTNNTACFDDNGHGTHVAGIVAANGSIKGVAPGTKIVAVKALDSEGSGYSSDVAAGIDWCTSNSTNLNISAISMSLGGGMYETYCDNQGADNTLFASSINAAVGKNISVVVATGNNGTVNNNAIASPACIQNATRVGATTKTPETISSFTSRGVDFHDMLLAPGVSINSTVPSGSCELCAASGYNTLEGTSMATPHVSGAIALLSQAYKSAYGNLPTPAFLRAKLNETGKKIYDSQTALNFSRIDVLGALDTFIAPNITAAYNNMTNNGSATITMNESDSVFFNISVDQHTSFFWYLNGTQQNSTASNFSWHAGYNDSGTWSVQVVASNGYLNSSFQWNITVLNLNRPPYISPPLENIIMQRQSQAPYNLSANMHDDDGDNLTLTADDGNITVSGFILYFNYTELFANKSATIIVNDSVLAASQAINITVIDTMGPQFSVTSPENKSYNTTNITLGFSIDEPASWCGYSLNGTANITLPSCANATLGASEGENNLTLYANDTLGNWNSGAMYFTVDTTPPQINITAPDYTTDDFVLVNATISEAPASCVLSFNGTEYAMEKSGNICTYNVTSLAPSTYNFSVFANDSAGNINRTQNFSVHVYYCFESYGAWSACISGKKQRVHTIRSCASTTEQETCTIYSAGGSGGFPAPLKNKTLEKNETNVTLAYENKSLKIENQAIVIQNETRNAGEKSMPGIPKAPNDTGKITDAKPQSTEPQSIKSLLDFGRTTANMLFGRMQAVTQAILKWLFGLFF